MERVMNMGASLLKVHPDEAKAYTINGDIYLNAGKNREARYYFTKAIELDQRRFPIWSQLMILEADLGIYDTLLIHCNQALELFPNQPGIYYFRGYGNTRTGDFREAIEDYQKGIDLTIDNDALKVQFYLGLGEVYHELNRSRESDEAFENVLKIDSNNTIALNNYSYYLSLRIDKLEQAKRMSARSIKLEPNQATYLDTYAWILYQMKDYAEARVWMEKALKHGGHESGVILEHMGDILFQLKEEQEAIKYWNKASEAGGGTELLERKRKEGRLYE
jgi:tetratricopeptide (TPR) repeat protein